MTGNLNPHLTPPFETKGKVNRGADTRRVVKFWSHRHKTLISNVYIARSTTSTYGLGDQNASSCDQRYFSCLKAIG